MTDNTDTEQLSLVLPFDKVYQEQVVMLHELEDMTYSLSDMGQAVFFEILRKLDSRKDHEGQVVSITASEMEQEYQAFSRSSIYRGFDKACDEVRDMRIYRVSETEEKVIVDDISVFDAGRREYDKDKKTSKRKIRRADFRIHSDVAKYLTQITKDMRFTMFMVMQTRKLKKAPSARLYQWLRRHHYLTKKSQSTFVEIKADKLRYKLAFDRDRLAPEWRQFNLRILKPAIKDINEVTDLSVSFDVSGRGGAGKIETLRFCISSKPEAEDMESEDQEGELLGGNLRLLSEELVAAVRSVIPEITNKQLDMLGLHEDVVIRGALTAFMKSENIKNPVSYFLKVVEKSSYHYAAACKNSTNASGMKNHDRFDTSWADGLGQEF